MIYLLSKEQWHKIWKNPNKNSAFTVSTLAEIETPSSRMEYWNKHHKNKYNISYTEFDFDMKSTSNFGVWGLVEGNEKDINWFILQL